MKTTTAALAGAQLALSPIPATREIRRRRHPRTTPLLTTAVLALGLGAATANAQPRAPDPGICVRYAEADHAYEHSPPRVEALAAAVAVETEVRPAYDAAMRDAEAIYETQQDRAQKAYAEAQARAQEAWDAARAHASALADIDGAGNRAYFRVRAEGGSTTQAHQAEARAEEAAREGLRLALIGPEEEFHRAQRAARENLTKAQTEARFTRDSTREAAREAYYAAKQTVKEAFKEADAQAETERAAAYDAVYDSDPHAAQSDVDTLMKKLKRRHRALCKDIVHKTYAPTVTTCVRYPEAEEAWKQSPVQVEAEAAYEAHWPVRNKAYAVRSAKEEQARAKLRASTDRADRVSYAVKRHWDGIVNAISGDTSRWGEKKAALERAAEIREATIQRAHLRHNEILAAAEAEFEAAVRETKTSYDAAKARSLAVRQAAYDAIYDADPEAVRSAVPEIMRRLRDRHEYLCKYVLALHM